MRKILIALFLLVLVPALFLYAGPNDRFSDIELQEDEKIQMPEISAPSGNTPA